MESYQSHPIFSVLIVEDDKAARDIMVRMVDLKFPRCTVYSAENGKRGLELFKAHSPEMVITDINMPVMDGIEMAREIRLIDANAIYIVLTAYGNQSFLDEFNEIGYCAYLMKPIDFKALFAVIEKCSVESKLPRE